MNGRTDQYFDMIEQVTINRKLYFAKLHYLLALLDENKVKEAKEFVKESLLNE